MFTSDSLHQIEQSNSGKHMWPWLLETVLDTVAQDKLDERFALTAYLFIYYLLNSLLAFKPYLHFLAYITFQMVLFH